MLTAADRVYELSRVGNRPHQSITEYIFFIFLFSLSWYYCFLTCCLCVTFFFNFTRLFFPCQLSLWFLYFLSSLSFFLLCNIFQFSYLLSWSYVCFLIYSCFLLVSCQLSIYFHNLFLLLTLCVFFFNYLRFFMRYLRVKCVFLLILFSSASVRGVIVVFFIAFTFFTVFKSSSHYTTVLICFSALPLFPYRSLRSHLVSCPLIFGVSLLIFVVITLLTGFLFCFSYLCIVTVFLFLFSPVTSLSSPSSLFSRGASLYVWFLVINFSLLLICSVCLSVSGKGKGIKGRERNGKGSGG